MRKTNNIWDEFVQACADSKAIGEDIGEFQKRMEKLGYVLEYRKPSKTGGMSDAAFVEAVIGRLNEKTGATYRAKPSNANGVRILQLRAQGYELEDLLAVIDKKTAQWMGTSYQVNLTPETLFSRKHFDNYLGQKAASSSTTSAAQPAPSFWGRLAESMEQPKEDI